MENSLDLLAGDPVYLGLGAVAVASFVVSLIKRTIKMAATTAAVLFLYASASQQVGLTLPNLTFERFSQPEAVHSLSHAAASDLRPEIEKILRDVVAHTQDPEVRRFFLAAQGVAADGYAIVADAVDHYLASLDQASRYR